MHSVHRVLCGVCQWLEECPHHTTPHVQCEQYKHEHTPCPLVAVPSFTACCRCPASTDGTDSEALLTATTNKMTFPPPPPSVQPHVPLSVCPTHLWCDPTPYLQWWTRAGRWAIVQWIVKSVIWLKPALNSPPPPPPPTPHTSHMGWFMVLVLSVLWADVWSPSSLGLRPLHFCRANHSSCVYKRTQLVSDTDLSTWPPPNSSPSTSEPHPHDTPALSSYLYWHWYNSHFLHSLLLMTLMVNLQQWTFTIHSWRHYIHDVRMLIILNSRTLYIVIISL